MKKSNLHIAILLTLGAMSNGAVAAGPGPGGGGGGHGSGSGGGGGVGGEKGSILGDLVALYRDASGIPILTNTVDKCQQPLGAVSTCPVDLTNGLCVLPVDPATCAVATTPIDYTPFLQPVDFARISVARSPASVLDQQLGDVLVNLSTASCLSLDPAGRIVFTAPDTADSDDDGNTTELISNAVDSPLQNLAIYKELMIKGVLGVPPITLPTPPVTGYGYLDTAAKGLGTAADKGGKISVDLVVYLNQILGLSNKDSTTQLPKTCITVREEVKGVVQEVEKCFLNFGAYGYARAQTYSKLPYPAYIPTDPNPIPGTFEYLDVYSVAADPVPTLFSIHQGLITDVVFDSQAGFTAGNIGGFAQASDDARATIDFMHSHPVLAGYETAIPCAGSPPTPTPPFDVALSTLQMPIRMVANTEREGTITVTNNGPNAATGTVNLFGTDSGQYNLSQNFDFTNLAAGQSQSWTVMFTAPVYATTIEWNATVIAPGDVLSSNNTLTASTLVLARSGSPTRGESTR